MFGKFLDPKNDLAFKRIFGTKRNRDILIHFVNDIFDLHTNPVEEVTLSNELTKSSTAFPGLGETSVPMTPWIGKASADRTRLEDALDAGEKKGKLEGKLLKTA